MFKTLRSHLKRNDGDAHVSKMTMIAIVFVVGAILLVLTTSAFRNPINRWLGKVTNDWFSYDNGMFTQSTSKPLDMLGIKDNTKYAGYNDNGDYYEITFYEDKIVLTCNIVNNPAGSGTVEYAMSDCSVIDGQYFVIGDPSNGDWLQISGNRQQLVAYDLVLNKQN